MIFFPVKTALNIEAKAKEIVKKQFKAIFFKPENLKENSMQNDCVFWWRFKWIDLMNITDRLLYFSIVLGNRCRAHNLNYWSQLSQHFGMDNTNFTYHAFSFLFKYLFLCPACQSDIHNHKNFTNNKKSLIRKSNSNCVYVCASFLCVCACGHACVRRLVEHLKFWCNFLYWVKQTAIWI